MILEALPGGQWLGRVGGWQPPQEINRLIVLQVRLPRVILAALVGAALALAGSILQALFRNPLADPYVTGVSSGASLGAALALTFWANLNLLGIGAVPFFAFLGALAALVLVYRLAQVEGATPVTVLLLAGIAVGSCFSAGVSLLVYFSQERAHGVVFWLLGSLGGATWQEVRLVVPYLAAGFAAAFFYAREMNALLFGEETAWHLGVEVEKMKRWGLVTGCLLTAAAVSVSGIIGFLGLVTPHVVRMLTGPDHRVLLPGAALAGAILLLAADTLARTLIAPTELPVGIITTMLGGPFFIYLLRRRKKLPYFSGSE